MNPIKLVITSKRNLQFKYGNKFSAIEKLLTKLEKADKAKMLDTKTVFIDDAASAKAAGIKAVTATTPKECKRAVDELFQKHSPVYIAIVGAQDVIPFQEIVNPAEDNDLVIPTDLPYACDAPYNRNIDGFVGPTRVVGRIPDIPGKADIGYLTTVIENSIAQKPGSSDAYGKYFSISAWVWRKSTEQSLLNMFGHNGQLQLSPPKEGKFTKMQLKPLVHFYNCHGAPKDASYYGQKSTTYPKAITATDLEKNISPGTVAAAECCYGAELTDPNFFDSPQLSIANTYMGNKALAFLGSSTIAYGPSEGQGLADLITQYFIKEIMCGASIGRALLQARQEFLSNSGPQLDPYELKTLAQFYLLGDPSVQPVLSDSDTSKGPLAKSSIANNRMRLYSKGMSLKKSITPAKEMKTKVKSSNEKELKEVLKELNFAGADEKVYEVKPKTAGMTGMEKTMMGESARFRTYIKSAPGTKNNICNVKVLVVKENKEQLLGWRMYVSK
jgi:hypothetical protein